MHNITKEIALKVLQYLESNDTSQKAHYYIDCAGPEGLPIVLMGLVDTEVESRAVAADVISAEPYNFIEAKSLLLKLYQKEIDDGVKINMLSSLAKWDIKEINGKSIKEEFEDVLNGKQADFIRWAREKAEKYLPAKK